MVVMALALLAVLAVAAVAAAALRRRRVLRRGLAPRIDPAPAGMKHLAARVSELSDLGLHLPAASRTLAPKRRLGALLGLR
jgi:hypothetical protein